MTDEGKLKETITKDLERLGCIVIRMQSGVFRSFDNRRIVRVGTKGIPDLLVIRPDGVAAFVELKREGRSKTYIEQAEYIRALQSRGIRAGIAKSTEEAVAIAGLQNYVA